MGWMWKYYGCGNSVADPLVILHNSCSIVYTFTKDTTKYNLNYLEGEVGLLVPRIVLILRLPP